jgi:hypothetical protein
MWLAGWESFQFDHTEAQRGIYVAIKQSDDTAWREDVHNCQQSVVLE